jgi:hypothetical protein
MRSEQSYRMSRNLTLATHIGITSSNKKRDTLPVWQDIPDLRKQGEDPYQILELILQRYGIETKGVYECVKAIGSGSSPWIQISKFLMNSARSI